MKSGSDLASSTSTTGISSSVNPSLELDTVPQSKHSCDVSNWPPNTSMTTERETRDESDVSRVAHDVLLLFGCLVIESAEHGGEELTAVLLLSLHEPGWSGLVEKFSRGEHGADPLAEVVEDELETGQKWLTGGGERGQHQVLEFSSVVQSLHRLHYIRYHFNCSHRSLHETNVLEYKPALPAGQN